MFGSAKKNGKGNPAPTLSYKIKNMKRLMSLGGDSETLDELVQKQINDPEFNGTSPKSVSRKKEVLWCTRDEKPAEVSTGRSFGIFQKKLEAPVGFYREPDKYYYLKKEYAHNKSKLDMIKEMWFARQRYQLRKRFKWPPRFLKGTKLFWTSGYYDDFFKKSHAKKLPRFDGEWQKVNTEDAPEEDTESSDSDFEEFKIPGFKYQPPLTLSQLNWPTIEHRYKTWKNNLLNRRSGVSGQMPKEDEDTDQTEETTRGRKSTDNFIETSDDEVSIQEEIEGADSLSSIQSVVEYDEQYDPPEDSSKNGQANTDNADNNSEKGSATHVTNYIIIKQSKKKKKKKSKKNRKSSGDEQGEKVRRKSKKEFKDKDKEVSPIGSVAETEDNKSKTSKKAKKNKRKTKDFDSDYKRTKDPTKVSPTPSDSSENSMRSENSETNNNKAAEDPNKDDKIRIDLLKTSPTESVAISETSEKSMRKKSDSISTRSDKTSADLNSIDKYKGRNRLAQVSPTDSIGSISKDNRQIEFKVTDFDSRKMDNEKNTLKEVSPDDSINSINSINSVSKDKKKKRRASEKTERKGTRTSEETDRRKKERKHKKSRVKSTRNSSDNKEVK